MKHPLHLSARLAVASCVCACLVSVAWGARPPQSSSPEPQQVQSHEPAMATIPGPLRSFLRMAGIS
ncbi:MAG: hypothetical protein WBQ31_05175, partial [Candidatus Acidiferrales bacterium]